MVSGALAVPFVEPLKLQLMLHHRDEVKVTVPAAHCCVLLCAVVCCGAVVLALGCSFVA